MITKNHIIIRFLFLLFIPVFISGCNEIKVESVWNSKKITIDGMRGTEWDGAMVQIKDIPVVLGMLNDSNYFYLLLVTSDRGIQRQILFRGLTVWFDRHGSNEKILGIHYPLISFADNYRERWTRDPREDSLFDNIPLNTNDMEITGPMKDEKERVNVNQLRQIEARINISEGYLIYELKVPLADTGLEPYAIGTKPGETIGVGIERGESNSGRDSERPVGLFEGGRGRDGTDGMRRSFGTGQTSSLNLWASVKLAQKNN